MRHIPVLIALAALLALALPRPSAATGADYEKALAYLRAGKAAEAISILKPMAGSGKPDPYVSYHLGVAYYKAGRLDESYAEFKRTASLSPDKAAGEFRLGIAYSNLGVEYYRAGNHEDAARCFGEALAMDPDDGDSRYYLGLVKLEAGDYPGAIEELDRAGALMSGDPARAAAAQNARATAYYRKGDNAKASAGFAATLEKDPGNVEALYYSGLIAYKEHGYAAARPYFDRIAQTGAQDEATREALFTTFFNMGVDFQDRGKSESAAEMFGRASLIRPDDAQTHYYLGYNLMAAERYEEAVTEFRHALSLGPGLERAKAQMEVAGRFASDKALERAASMMSAGEFYAALPLYEKAASLAPSGEAARKGLASAKEAIRKDTHARAAEARALLAKGDYAAAKARSAELSRLNPGSSDAAALEREINERIAAVSGKLLKKAAEAENRGELGEAASGYGALLDVDPDNAKAGEGLGRVNAVIARTRQKAAKAMKDGLLVEARAAYRELAGYVPGDADAASGLRNAEEAIAHEAARRIKDAKSAFGGEDYSMAAYHAGRALELDPDNPEALELRGLIRDRSRELVLRYVREGDEELSEGLRDKAARSYESALLLDPDNRAAKAGLEKARLARKGSGSEEEVRQLYLKGVDHYTRGELELAVQAWREVLRIDPGNEKAASSIKRAQEKMTQTGGSTREDR